MTPPETNTEVLTAGPAHALAGLLGVDGPPEDGLLPPLWHWVYLLDRPPTPSLGLDGHRVLGGIPAPPGPGRRRMFAGGRLAAAGGLQLGELATRHSEVIASVQKQGRLGGLTFVTVRHRISQRGQVVVEDEQDIVYRPGVSAVAPVGSAMAPTPETTPTQDLQPAREVTTRVVEVDPILLFRFSALTYNAHRIHYDRNYAREREGYPSLVVHGPLQALLMAELARARIGPPAEQAHFEYRLTSPLFQGQGLVVEAGEDEGVVRTAIRDSAGRLTATGRFCLR